MRLFRRQFENLARQSRDCQCCERHANGFAAWANFCPECGTRLRTAEDPARRNSTTVLGRLWMICFGQFKRGVAVPLTGGRTPILVGYGNTLFTLGWRYERGGRISGNLPEAIRCYRKSARLGNLDAMLRLAVGETSGEARRVIW
jgi:TPR repeat protein